MAQSERFTRSYFIKWAVCVLLAALFFLIPITEVYTVAMRNFFAITVFVMAIVAFGFFDMAIPAFLLVSLYVFSGTAPAGVVFGPWSGGTTMFMLIGAFVFANVLGETGLLKRVSYWTILKLGGRFNGLVYALYFAGIIMALLTFHNAYILVTFLTFSLLKALDIKKFSKEAIVLCAAGAIGAYGITPFVYAPAENAMIDGAIGSFLPDVTFTWYTRTLYGWPIFFAGLLTLFLLTRIYKTKNTSLGDRMDSFRQEYEAMGPLSLPEKKAIVCTVILAGYLILSTPMGWQANYVFMILPWIMIMPGAGIGTVKSFKDVYMGTLFFISGCMAIGTVGAHVGLGNLITTVVTPHLQGLPPIALMFAFVAVGALANFALTPFAMLGSLSAPFCQLAISLNLNPMFALMSLITSISTVFMPHEVTCFVVLFGFGYFKMKDFMKFMGLYSLVIFVFMGVIVFPYWTLLGLV